MFKKICLIALSFGLCNVVIANTTAQDFPALKAFAKSLSAKPLDAMKQFNPEKTFKNYNNNPEQKGLYNNVETEKTDLTAQSSSALKSDLGGKTVVEQFGKNQFEINQNNDAIQRAKLIEDESYAITHGLSNDRIQCDERPQTCEIKTHTETCFTSRQLPPQQCVKKRKLTVSTENINQRVAVVVIIAKKWTGIVTANLVTGSIQHAAGGSVTNPVRLTHPCDAMSASVDSIQNNGQFADWVKVIGSPSCSNNGLLTLNIKKEWNRSYPIQIALTVHAQSKPYVSSEQWDNECASLEAKSSLCHVTDVRCTDANSTHVIDGLPIERDCWEETNTFSCASAQADECAIQREKKCLQLSSRCARMDNNACAVYEQTYNCFDKVCPAPIPCVKDLFCADGDCTDHQGTQNDEFAKDIIPLAVVGVAGHEYAQTQASLFSGHVVECKIEILDFINCCSDKGWGKALDIAHCPEEDKALGQAKLNYLVHYLGKYCSHKDLGICDEHKRTYCVFDTKMARIIQEEGRLKQLNGGALGTAKHPNCGGLSIAELQSLDMARIEFLKPEYPFNGGEHLEEAGIVVPPPVTSNINDEVIRRVQKKVGG